MLLLEYGQVGAIPLAEVPRLDVAPVSVRVDLEVEAEHGGVTLALQVRTGWLNCIGRIFNYDCKVHYKAVYTCL